MNSELVERSIVELKALNLTARQDIRPAASPKVTNNTDGLFQTSTVDRYRRLSESGGE